MVAHVPGAGENTLRRLALFSYRDHPPKNDVTSGLNCAEQLGSQSEKMAFRLAKILLYFQTIKFVSFHTEGRGMLQDHFFDFLSKTFGKREQFSIVLKLIATSVLVAQHIANTMAARLRYYICLRN